MRRKCIALPKLRAAISVQTRFERAALQYRGAAELLAAKEVSTAAATRSWLRAFSPPQSDRETS